MFKTTLFQEKKNKDDNQWMMEGVDAEESRELKTMGTTPAGDSSFEEESDDDSVDLITEKKIYSSDHKHHEDTEDDLCWSIRADTRLSNDINPMKVKTTALKKVGMLCTREEQSMDSDESCYTATDDEDFDLVSERVVAKDEQVEKVSAPKGTKKKKKKTAMGGSARSIGSKKGNKKVKKKKKKDEEASEELGVTSPKAKKKKKKVPASKLKERIRASFGIIGNRGGAVPEGIFDKDDMDAIQEHEEEESIKVRDQDNLEVEKLSATSPLVKKKKKKKTPASTLKDRVRASFAMIGNPGGVVQIVPEGILEKEDMEAVQEDEEEKCIDQDDVEEDKEEVDAIQEDEEECIEQDKAEEDKEAGEDSTEKPAKLAALMFKGGASGASNDSMTPLDRFREAGKRMRTIQQIQSCAVDSQFAAIFHSPASDSVTAGLMSASDKATIEKLLVELQQYEEQLEKERNQIAKDRELMMLQQESVEHLLESESEKTRELEAIVLELETILEQQIHQQETEELVLKVQRLESELERREEALAKMAFEHQAVLKRQISSASVTERSNSVMSLSPNDLIVPDESYHESETAEDPQEIHETSSSSIRSIPNAKLQGELLQLRSSLNHKDNALAKQAKEIARLTELLEQSNNTEHAQKLSQVEATCEDFRNESKQFRSEIAGLKKQLEEVEAARRAEAVELERLKKANEEKTEALKRAEKERNEAVRKLKRHEMMNLTIAKPTESTIKSVLDIGVPANLPMPVEPIMADEVEVEAEESKCDDEVVNEKKNWFGFAEKVEEKKKEKEGSGWFGFGKKEDKDQFDQLLDA